MLVERGAAVAGDVLASGTRRLTAVDDHGLIADTLAMALGLAGVEVCVLDPAGEMDLAAAIAATAPDLVLLDLDLGDGRDGLDLITPLSTQGMALVVVTGTSDQIRHGACVQAGALGVLRKSASFDELLVAVTQVLHTGALLSRHERDEVLAAHRRDLQQQRDRLAPFEELSRREAEVLGELVQGRTAEAIARGSFVSVATVRTQVRAILTKLMAPSQIAAVARVREVAWVPPQEGG